MDLGGMGNHMCLTVAITAEPMSMCSVWLHCEVT